MHGFITDDVFLLQFSMTVSYVNYFLLRAVIVYRRGARTIGWSLFISDLRNPEEWLYYEESHLSYYIDYPCP